MACFFLTRLPVTRIKDGLKGPLSDSNLDEKTKHFHRSMEALDEQVNYLHLSSSVTANASIATMGPRVYNTEGMVVKTNKLAESIDDRTRLLSNHAGGIVTGLHGLRADVASQHDTTRSVEKRLDVNTRAIDHLSSVLQDVLVYAECK
jgi:hypothetical protein